MIWRGKLPGFPAEIFKAKLCNEVSNWSHKCVTQAYQVIQMSCLADMILY